MRLFIDDGILNKIIEKTKDDKIIYDHLKNAIKSAKKSNGLESKKKATKKAYETKIATSKAKIQNAINILRLENKKINAYQVAKTSGLNYNTVHKYFKEYDFE